MRSGLAHLRFSNYNNILDVIAAVLNCRGNIARTIEIKHRKIIQNGVREIVFCMNNVCM